MVYPPHDDSFLLKEFVKACAKGKVLDMGTGSGIQARQAANSQQVKSIVAVDIDKAAIAFAKEHNGHKKITYLQSDLFSKVPKTKFNTIVFNAPYLPQEGETRHIDLEGGKLGHETIERFLKDARNYLKSDGVILLAFSSLTPNMDELVEKYGFRKEELAKKHVFFEDLIVWLISPAQFIQEVEQKGVRNIAYFSRGKRGLIFTGKYKNKKVAIKVKRESTEALDPIRREADMLKIVNRYKIGPKFIFKTNHALVYQFVEGTLLRDITSKSQLKQVAKKVFDQCFILDRLKINKKEMTRPYKHVIVKGSKITLIDFERANQGHEPQNVTQFCQFSRAHFGPNERWINIAKEYAKNPSSQMLKKIRGLL